MAAVLFVMLMVTVVMVLRDKWYYQNEAAAALLPWSIVVGCRDNVACGVAPFTNYHFESRILRHAVAIDPITVVLPAVDDGGQ